VLFQRCKIDLFREVKAAVGTITCVQEMRSVFFKTVWKLAMLGDLLANNSEISIREAG